MGLYYGVNNNSGKISNDDGFEILRHANEAGICMLDTAEAYGEAHKIIGAYHKNNPDQRFKIVTKIPADRDNIDPGDKVHHYLDELNIHQLEVLMFHSFASYESQPELTDQFNELKSNGFLGHLGVSVYRNSEIELLLEDDRIDLIQLPYNLLDNHSIRGEVLERAKERGKIIHSRSAFLQGLFFMSPIENHPVIDPLKNELSRINEIAIDNDIPIEILALQYCLQQPYIDKVIIGVDSLEQLKSNIDACKASLDERILDMISEIRVNNIRLINPSLWN